MADSKAELRVRIRAGRAAAQRRASVADVADRLLRTARAAGLLRVPSGPGHVPPSTIAAYIAAPGEPDVGAIRSALRADGGAVLLPLPRADRVLEWARDNGRYEAHPRLPILMPCGPIQGVGASGLVDRDVHVLLIPALAVDTRGVRLGQGGGYYDRLLAELERLPVRDIRAVAVVHDDEVLPAGGIHFEAHDRRAHGALTPTRFLDFSD